MRGRTDSLPALVLAIVAYASWWLLVGLPAAGQVTVGFPTYYVASRLFLDNPSEFFRAYDPEWFVPQLFAYGTRVYDILLGQPPPFALIALPIAWLPPEQAKLSWGVAGMGFLGFGTILLARACGLSARTSMLVSPLPLLASSVLANTAQGQGYLYLYFLECCFLWALLRGRNVLAGVPLGMAAVTKSAFLWVWPILLFSRFRSSLLGAAATGAAVSIVVLARVGSQTWGAYVQNVRVQHSAATLSVTAYQTIHSLCLHLFRYEARWNPHPVIDAPNVAWALSVGARVAMLGTSCVWAMRAGSGREARILAFAMMFAPASVVMPAAEEYHFVLSIAPLLMAWVWLVRRRAGLLAAAALAVITLLLCGFYDADRLVDVRGWAALRAYPRVYGSFGLWLWLGWALQRR